jgi:hypothetical protein
MSKKIADLLEDIKRADEFGIENCHSPALQYEFSRKTQGKANACAKLPV